MPALPAYIVEPIWKHNSSCYCPQQCLGRTIRSAATAPAYRGSDGLREEAGAGFGLRLLRLREDRRRDLLGHHVAPQAQRVEIAQGVMNELRGMALEAYDKFIGPRLADVAVGCCIMLHPEKAPWGGEKVGRSPVVDRGKRGIKRSTAVDAEGIPLGTITAPANRHDSPLLGETLLDTLEALGPMPERVSVHLDRGYDSEATRNCLEDRGLDAVISQKGKPAPLQATKRWVVERTNSSWNNAHKKKLV